jgi:hypothetical protein
MNGNMSLSYIKSSSIHQTFNRAINIHASNYVTVENNIIFNILYVYDRLLNNYYFFLFQTMYRGGAVFLEDGVEIGNVIQGNLAVFVQTSSGLLNEDVTPAGFWVRLI